MEKILDENSNELCSKNGELEARQQHQRYSHADSKDCCSREYRRLSKSEDTLNCGEDYLDVRETNKRFDSKSPNFRERREFSSKHQHEKDSLLERRETVNPKFGTGKLYQKMCQKTTTTMQSADICDNNHWRAKRDGILENRNLNICATKEIVNDTLLDEDFATSPRKQLKDHNKQDGGKEFSKNGRMFVKSAEDTRKVFGGDCERLSKDGFNQRYGSVLKKCSTDGDDCRVNEYQSRMPPQCGKNFMGDSQLVMFESSSKRDQSHVCTTRAHKKVREWLQTSCSIDSGNDSIETVDVRLVTPPDDTKPQGEHETKNSMKETASNVQAKIEDLGPGSPLYKRLLKKKIRLQNEGFSASHSTFEHLREPTSLNSASGEKSDHAPSTQVHVSKLSANKDSLGLFPTATNSRNSVMENGDNDSEQPDKSPLLWRRGWNTYVAKIGTNLQRPHGDLIGLVSPQKGKLRKQLFQFDEAASLPPINCISKTRGKKVLTVLRKTKAGLEIENRVIHFLGQITEGSVGSAQNIDFVLENNSSEVDKRTVSWVENQISLNRRIKV
eukprot:Seg1354.11 transcript_id=Seg1354.11/GoldUCD/mRNA.D3Y31 product="hypothetical protein" protein_id=Seg1354.11/GoldUCD/D3Y31